MTHAVFKGNWLVCLQPCPGVASSSGKGGWGGAGIPSFLFFLPGSSSWSTNGIAPFLVNLRAGPCLGGPSARQALLSPQLTTSAALLGIRCTALGIYDMPDCAGCQGGNSDLDSLCCHGAHG